MGPLDSRVVVSLSRSKHQAVKMISSQHDWLTNATVAGNLLGLCSRAGNFVGCLCGLLCDLFVTRMAAAGWWGHVLFFHPAGGGDGHCCFVVDFTAH